MIYCLGFRPRGVLGLRTESMSGSGAETPVPILRLPVRGESRPSLRLPSPSLAQSLSRFHRPEAPQVLLFRGSPAAVLTSLGMRVIWVCLLSACSRDRHGRAVAFAPSPKARARSPSSTRSFLRSRRRLRPHCVAWLRAM